MELSTGLFLLMCGTKNPLFMIMLREIAEFEFAMLELATVTGLPITACADIVRNTVKDTDKPWREVAAQLKWKSKKGGKISG